MDERTTSEVVQDVMDDIAAKREETAKEEKTLAEKFYDRKAEKDHRFLRLSLPASRMWASLRAQVRQGLCG